MHEHDHELPTDTANIQYGTINVDRFDATSYSVCVLYCDTGDTPEDTTSHSIISHHHVTVTKEDESKIIIVDAENPDQIGAVLPLTALTMFTQFLAHIAEDPTVVMTDKEKAQFYANNLVAHYSANSN